MSIERSQMHVMVSLVLRKVDGNLRGWQMAKYLSLDMAVKVITETDTDTTWCGLLLVLWCCWCCAVVVVMVLCCCGVVGVVVLWCCCVVVLWCCGVVVLLVLWCCGVFGVVVLWC